MGGGGPSKTSQTTTAELPAWAQPFAKAILGQAMSTYFPGGNLLPASQAVAGFSPDQLAAMQMTEALSGVAPNAGLGWGTPPPPPQHHKPPTGGGPPSGSPPSGGGSGGTTPWQGFNFSGGIPTTK